MAKIKKELASGQLYEGYTYKTFIMPQDTPKVRAKKQKATSDAKREINRIQTTLKMMRLICLNFRAGKDLFLGLDIAGEPPEREQVKANLRRFLREMRDEYKKINLPFKYIWVIEEHDREGIGVREHVHMIINSAGYDEKGKRRDFDILARCWKAGDWTARRLAGADENFADTVEYLLKTYKDKPMNARSWSHSKNLKKPDKPTRTIVADSTRLEAPPGVKILRLRGDQNEFGGYEYLIGRIIDAAAFKRYCDKRDRIRGKRMRE
ncbi:rolling circle replication-associated protein [Intestinibacillus massiliensis]|uniref:rolling circle replication-associated protein n=1 Tax=Intestinibacillus massiliensis TaxID=1871029 RepID=UPI000B35FF92|nr:hypothetical protein [Intestinibacillus massiliensis]